MLMSVDFPPEPFNTLARSGKVGQIISRILEEIKPEVAYFTERDGKRGGIFVVNLERSAEVPKFSEPFFLNFNADCTFRIAMLPEDLQTARLDDLGKKWS
ncbi:MAG TPA: hypothetical protein VJ955_03975 [Desulfuromonadales bacterium]|nr:hypothetical protein [Desulfuromonadales bacterium]